MRVHIATARDVGQLCRAWAAEHMPAGWEMGTMEDCDALISVLYDKLLSEDFIASKRACFNFHPGLLPEYRGSGAYSWAFINGEKETGITLHEIDVSIDHGRIIERVAFPIKDTDTAGSLFDRACSHIFERFVHWFPLLLAGEYAAQAQDESRARMYYRKDLERAKDVTRYLRAFSFPGKEPAYYWKNGTKIYVDTLP